MLAAIDLTWMFWSACSVLALLGLYAMLSPQGFRKLATGSSKWIDTSRLVEVMDRQVDIDERVLRHARAFGAALLVATALIAYSYLRYIAG